MRLGDDDRDYDAIRGRPSASGKQFAPMLFDLFYPLLLAVIMTTIAGLLGYIDFRGLDVQQHLERLMRLFLN